MESLESRQLLTLMVDRIELLHDTGTSPDDRVTSLPTLVGHVQGDFSSGTVHVEFDHNYDLVAEGQVDAGPEQTFVYDPREFDERFVGFAGSVMLMYRPYRVSAEGQRVEEGFWSSFGFVLETPPPAPLRIEDLALVEDTGSSSTDSRTSNPGIRGRVVEGPDSGVAVSEALIELDVDGDLRPDDSLTTDDQGAFRYTPTGLAPGTVTVSARPRLWNLDTQAYDQGEWVQVRFHYEAPAAPPVKQLQWEDASASLGAGTSGIVVSGQLEGEPSEIAGRQVQVDTDGDGVAEGTVVSDRDGKFAYRIAAPGPGTLRVQARATRYHAATDSETYGEWVSAEFQLEPSVNPEILALQQQRDSTVDAGAGAPPAAVLTGQVDGVPGAATIALEWDHDGDGEIDGRSGADPEGTFRYLAAGLEPGEVTVRGRALAWDERLGETRAGDWASITFVWQAPPALDPVAPDLQLPHGSQDEHGNLVTGDLTVAGTIAGAFPLHEQGGTGGRVTIELDYDGDRQFDAVTMTDANGSFQFAPRTVLPGPATVAARARYWDAARQTGRFGPWSELSFVHVAPRTEPIDMVRLELASDSGVSQTDRITANSLVEGQVPRESAWPGLIVEFDEDGDGVVDGSTFVKADGSFTYAPRDASLGPKSLQARTVTWDPWRQEDLPGPWRGLAFTLESQEPAPALITELAAVGLTAEGTVTEARVRGRIVNENSLANVVIEVDTNGDAVLEQIVTTDALGRFEAELAGLDDGSVQVQVRSRELDAGEGTILYGAWTPLAFTLQRAQAATANIGELRLLNDTGESDQDRETRDARLQGRVDGREESGTTVVQFDHDEDDIVDGFVAVDAEGAFTYVPAGLSPGEITVRARTRWESPGKPARQGEWTTLQFVLTPAPAERPYISELQLARDTGQSATDGSTGDPSIRGRVVALETAEIPPEIVQLDLDSDGTPDAEATIGKDGTFHFTPEELPEGLVTIGARLEPSTGMGSTDDSTQDSASGASAWRELSFVYSANPDAPDALALAAAVSRHAASRAELAASFEASLRQSEREYAAARHAALADRDRQVFEAVQLRTQGIEAAEAAFLQENAGAQQQYREALQESAARLAGEVAGPIATSDEYVFEAFTWPDAPASVPPALAARPAPPPALAFGIEEAANYDLSTDRVHAEQVAAAQSEFHRATAEAAAERVRAQERALAEFEQAGRSAEALYQQRAKAADRAREEALATFQPEMDASAVDQADSQQRQQAHNTYQSALQNNAAAYQAAIRTAQRDETAAIESARAGHESRYFEITQRYFDAVSDPNLTPEMREQIEQAYYAELAENEMRTATAIADARQLYKQITARETQLQESADADAEAGYLQAIAALQRSRSDIMAAQQHQKQAFIEQVQYDHRLAMAGAERDRKLALNAAQRKRAQAEAEADRQYGVSLAAAEQTLQESVAQRREQAIARYAQFDANAWSEYQSALATNQWQFAQHQASAQREYRVALEDAEFQRVVGLAGARREQEDAMAEASYQRDLEHARQLLTYGLTAADAAESQAVLEAGQWEQRALRIVGAEQTLRIRLADKTHDVAVGIAQTERDHEIAASEIEAQRLLNVGTAERERSAILARHTRDVAIARQIHAGNQRGIDARQARDEAIAAARRDYAQGYVASTRDHARTLTAARDQFASSLAVAERTLRLASANAQGEVDKTVASLETAWRSAWTAVGSELRTASTTSAATRRISDATAERDTRVAVAAQRLEDITQWAAPWETPWSDFQRQLARTELDRVVAVGDAAVGYAEQSAAVELAWSLDVGTAELDWTGARAEAFQRQAVEVVAAADRLAAVSGSAQLTYDLLISERTAAHDFEVVEANYRREWDRAEARAAYEQAMAAAGWEYEREKLAAELEEQLTRRQADLDARLGLLTSTEHEQRLADARAQLNVRLQTAEQVRRQAEAAAETGRVEAETTGRLAWTVEVGDLAVAWTDGTGSAAEALAGALEQAGLDFQQGETQAGQNFAAAVSQADQLYHVHLAVADAARGEGAASAWSRWDVALVAASANWEVDKALAKNQLQLAELGDYADMRGAQVALMPSERTRYQAAVAEAQVVWAQHVGAARDGYWNTMSRNAVDYAGATNGADEQLAAALLAADVSAASGRAAADTQRAVQYATATADLTSAQNRALLEQGTVTVHAGRQYQTTLARAHRDLAVALAEADARWTRSVAAAEETLYVQGDTPETSEEYDRAVAEATDIWQQAVDQARISWAGSVGAAGVTRMEQLGSAEIDRAAAFGDAHVAFAGAVGNFMTLFTAEVTGREEQWMQASTLARAEQAVGLASSRAAWITESAAAATLLSQQTAHGQANLSAERAAAEIEYHLSVTAEDHVQLAHDAPGSLAEATAEARRQWLSNLGDEYVAFARGTAEADGQRAVAWTGAAADLDRARAAAEVERMDRRGALEFTHASNQTGAWGAFERTLVMHENRRRNTDALAGKSLDVAYAEAAVRRAIDEAMAQRDFLLATAAGNANAPSERQLALDLAGSDYEEARVRAEHAWRAATIAGESLFQTEHASALHALRTAITGFDQRYYVQLASAVERQQRQVAAAGADYAIAEFDAVGALRERLVAEATGFEGRMRLEESTARREVAQTLGTDASQLQAALAEARLEAWPLQQSVFTNWTGDVRTVQTTYQQTVADAYREHEVDLAVAARGWITRVAEAVSQSRLATAQSQHEYFITRDGVAESYLTSLNDAELELRLQLENARRQRTLGGSAEDFEQSVASAEGDFESARRSARFAFAAGETAALGQLRIAQAQAEQTFASSTSELDRLFALDADALDAAFSDLESLAHATRENALDDLAVAAALSGSDALIEQLALHADAAENPWLRFERDRSEAERSRDEALLTAATRRNTALESHRLEFESADRHTHSQWRQAAVAAQAERVRQQAAANAEREQGHAANDEALPQLAARRSAPPALPQPRPGLQKSLQPVTPPELPTEGRDLDLTARLPLFTPPQPQSRLRGQALLQQGLRTSDPEPSIQGSGRHDPHLTAAVPTRIELLAGTGTGQGAGDQSLPTVGRLLTIAENAGRTPGASHGERVRDAAAVQLALSSLVLRDAPQLKDFASFREWLDAESSYRQQLGRDVLHSGGEAQLRLWFGLREAVARDYFTPRPSSAGSIGAPADPDDFARQLAEERFQNLGFLQRRATLRHWEETTDQFWLGEYTDSVTAEGIAGEVGLSLTGLDLPMDLRDLNYQLTHWQWTWEHVGKTGLYGVSVLPVVGVVKNARHLEHLKHADSASSLSRVSNRLPSLESAADAGRPLADQGDDAHRLLLPSDSSCFVAGTHVLVALPDPPRTADTELAAEPMVAELETAWWSACRRWTAVGLLGLGTALAAGNSVIPRRRRRDLGHEEAQRRKRSMFA